MTHKTAYFAPISGFLGSINHAISGIFFEKIKPSNKERSDETSSYLRFDSADFSKPDQSELLMHEEDIDPLLEAEVYVIYGRNDDARAVLDSALKAGTVTAGDVALFWSLRKSDGITGEQRPQ